MPHAWLIGGPRGIGKATLAYRMARFVFAHPDPATPAVQHARRRSRCRPTIRRCAASPRRATAICSRSSASRTTRARCARSSRSTMVRSTIGFFGSTAGEGGWRVCIVDAADELNAAGANALLKILEEPPREVPAAGGEPCAGPAAADHPLALPPPRAAPAVAGGRRARGRRRAAARRRRSRHQGRRARRDGSVARALDLLGGTALQVRERVNALLGRAAGGRSARPARARRRARAATRRAFDGLRRCRARLAQRPRHGGRRGARAASRALPRCGRSSTRRRATSRSSISSESRWFSTCSAGLPTASRG